MDLNDKTIASLQPNVSPGGYNLKFQANETNFENCSARQYFKNPYRNPFQSSSLLAIRTFFCICCFKRIFLYFTEFDGHFACLNLANIRDAVPFKGYFHILLNLMAISHALIWVKSVTQFFYLHYFQ